MRCVALRCAVSEVQTSHPGGNLSHVDNVISRLRTERAAPMANRAWLRLALLYAFVVGPDIKDDEAEHYGYWLQCFHLTL